MAVFYEAVLNGSFKGKDFRNTLYYRTEVDVMGGAFGFGGARELAQCIIDQVVPSYLDVHPTDYLLEQVEIHPRNAIFEAMYQLPFYQEVNQHGTCNAMAGGYDSPALCINVRFNLEPQVIGLQAFTAPKRGYISIGPMASSWLNDDGKVIDVLITDENTQIHQLCADISKDLVGVLPPALFAPIRVAKHYGSAAGGFLGWGYADVQGATFDEYASFRRSRRIRG